MKVLIHQPNRVLATVSRYQRLVTTFSNWPLHLAAKWGWLGQRLIILKTRSGWEIEVPCQLRHTLKEIFLYHTYVHREILADLPEKPVVIDVGGNVGFFSLFALHLRPQARCFTFEPVTGNFSQLQKNQRRNPRADWHIFHAAVAGQDGAVQISSPTGQDLVTDASIKRPGRPAARSAGVSETVQACALQTIFEREGISHCDWLKLDCEGAEYEILYNAPSALFDRISCITMETHFGDGSRNNTGAVADYLEGRGYNVWVGGDVIYAMKAACD